MPTAAAAAVGCKGFAIARLARWRLSLRRLFCGFRILAADLVDVMQPRDLTLDRT